MDQSQTLLNSSEEDFRRVVDEEVRGCLKQETCTALRSPPLLNRWYLALISMKKNVESQLGSKRSDLIKIRPELTPEEYEQRLVEFHRWRAGAIRFKNGVEDRLLEVRARRQTLTTAISLHKNTVLKEFAEDEISDADRDLWKALTT